MAIGAGLTLLLLRSVGAPYGYLTIASYAGLVLFSGWAFARLAFGAFNLFNPIVLGGEPLEVLHRAIGHLGARGVAGDEAVLRAASRQADHALQVLSELIELTSDRRSVARDDLALLVELLLAEVRFYGERKHLLTPTSAWFPQAPAYPRWVETGFSEMSVALQTSTPLQPRLEPVTDWLEKRSAELASVALETCIEEGDTDAALRVTRAAGVTAKALAGCYRLDDALAFATVVRDGCLSNQQDSATARLLTSEPPLILTELLLGWRDAIRSWPTVIRSTVFQAEWDVAKTSVVHVRGPERVWKAAQRLLQEVQAEHAIEGRRVTPDWYLQSALATECILSLQEFASGFPSLLDDFIGPTLEHSSPASRVAAGSQALQAIAKAELVVDEISQALEGLKGLQRGHDPQSLDELVGLSARVRARQNPILQSLATAVIELQPEESTSAPDLFGEALFRLIHHSEQAIADGNPDLLGRVFEQVLSATLTLQRHLIALHGPPTHQFSPAIYNPLVDLLELSGLALIYQVLRDDDNSAGPVRGAWEGWAEAHDSSEEASRAVLDILDSADGGIPAGSPRRTQWESRLVRQVVDAGYATPESDLFGNQPPWSAPLLIKVLGVEQSPPGVSVHPRAIFAATVIGPLSGETKAELRARPGLRHYFENLDTHSESGTQDEIFADDSGPEEDGSE